MCCIKTNQNFGTNFDSWDPWLHHFAFKGALHFGRKSCSPVSWLLNNHSFFGRFSTNDLRAPEQTPKSFPEINSSINFSWSVVYVPFYSCLCINQCGLTSGMSCRLTFESIDRQPPSMLGEQKRQMWGAVMWGRKPACDWYGCHRERSKQCLKKTELSILLPFKQTKGHLCCYTLWLLPASPK